MTSLPQETPRLRWRTPYYVHVVVVVVVAMAWYVAPGNKHQPTGASISALSTSIAQISATLLVAVALFQGTMGGTVDHRVRRWISPLTFLYLGVATAVGVVGSIPSLADAAYRYLFAVALGTAFGGLLTVLLMGWANIDEQHAAAILVRVRELDEKPPAVPE